MIFPRLNPKKKEAQQLKEAKAHFLLLCTQYAHMGKLFKAYIESLPGTEFVELPAHRYLKSISDQYQEMGEQLKSLGFSIDDMGGKPVMVPVSPGEENPIK